MTNATRQLLLDVVVSCQAIGQYTAGLDFAAYEHKPMVRDAVERRLGIIGEALSRLRSWSRDWSIAYPSYGKSSAYATG